jgi:hypothetical protein
MQFYTGAGLGYNAVVIEPTCVQVGDCFRIESRIDAPPRRGGVFHMDSCRQPVVGLLAIIPSCQDRETTGPAGAF